MARIAASSSGTGCFIPSRPTVDDLDAAGRSPACCAAVVDHGFVLTQVPAVRGSRDGAEALQRLAERAPVLGRTTFRSGQRSGATTADRRATGATGYEDGGWPGRKSPNSMRVWSSVSG